MKRKGVALRRRNLKGDPIKRLWGYYRTAAVWGVLLVGAALIENLPVWGGRLWLLPFLPPVAGWRRGRVVGLFVGIAAGFLHDWTANSWFGVAGLLLGAVGFLCGGVGFKLRGCVLYPLTKKRGRNKSEWKNG